MYLLVPVSKLGEQGYLYTEGPLYSGSLYRGTEWASERASDGASEGRARGEREVSEGRARGEREASEGSSQGSSLGRVRRERGTSDARTRGASNAQGAMRSYKLPNGRSKRHRPQENLNLENPSSSAPQVA